MQLRKKFLSHRLGFSPGLRTILFFSLSLFFLATSRMRSNSKETWDKLGNNVDNCEDMDYKCAKSVSRDDDVACRQVTISLTLGRTGWTAEVTVTRGEYGVFLISYNS